MAFDVDKKRKEYALTEEELRENADSIFAELALTVRPTKNPTFVLVGGQAGAGKSGLVSRRNKELDGNAIIIDQDELRTKYPAERYAKIHSEHTEREEFLILNPYIAQIIQEIIKRAKQGGYNIILESALQDPKAFIDNAIDLRKHGYTTEMSVLSVPEVEGNISMLTRYCYYLEKDGECRRNTRLNPQAIPKMRANIGELDKLGIFDDINIYIRGDGVNSLPTKIYSKSQSPSVSPVQAFDEGQKISLKRTMAEFPEKYEGIKATLVKFGEKEQLEKLELIKTEFEKQKVRGE